MVISDPSYWKESFHDKGPKYDKIKELIAALNILLGSQDHGNLAGLADDDHTQYLRTDGSRALTGDQSAGSNKITNLATPTATTDAVTKTYVDQYFGIGSANALLIPCSLNWHHTIAGNAEFTAGGGEIINRLTGAIAFNFQIENPTNLGSLKLYIKTAYLGLEDADASNYIDRFRIFGSQATSTTALLDDTTNYTSVGEKTYTPGAPIDCSTYKRVGGYVNCQTNLASALDITYVILEVYYDT